ncbi:MAG: SdiA-regulated domain-containing protein [Sphingobacterium sp.]|jgi:uncharacterized protein YjiK|nr:SdiA-regulated domain-containing protein [Sphingobacterium sp.]
MTTSNLKWSTKRLRIFLCLTFGIVINSLWACNPNATKQEGATVEQDTSQFSYALTSGEAFTMPAVLDEISGITYLATFPHTIFAVQDEEGILFTFDLKKGEVIGEFKFAGRGDYEGIASDGTHFFVLKSNGDIYSFPIGATDKSAVKQHNALLPNGEYESMAYDTQTKKLHVLCKSCKDDKKAKTTTGYQLNLSSDGALSVEKTFVINIDEIKQLDKTMGKSFKASAMAKHPTKEEWYIISSVDRALIVTNKDFSVQQVIRFERDTFEQPEGLTFDEQLNLYISSEAGNKAEAKIYRIKPKG